MISTLHLKIFIQSCRRLPNTTRPNLGAHRLEHAAGLYSALLALLYPHSLFVAGLLLCLAGVRCTSCLESLSRGSFSLGCSAIQAKPLLAPQVSCAFHRFNTCWFTANHVPLFHSKRKVSQIEIELEMTHYKRKK